MKVTEPEDAQQYADLFDATIRQAVGGARSLMARLVAHVRASLRAQEDEARERRERDRLTHSRRMLNQFETALCERFAEELLNAFNRLSSVERPTVVPASVLQFDRVATMDDAQVRDHVHNARARQAVQAAADAALAELNRLICTLLGLQEVRLERNPLRPSVYVDAVMATLSHVPVPATNRQAWISLMCAALGHELDIYYHDLCADLRDKGVGAASGLQARDADASPRSDSGLLTLEKLRQLLADAPRTDAADSAFHFSPTVSTGDGQSVFATQDNIPTAFSPTVPAAFDALRDMKQVGQVARRLQARSSGGDSVAADLPADRREARERLRATAQGLEQQLGLEVVEMMVDNITHDARLLAPVQHIVAQLEPALLQLALVDPRFFSHKQHPARRLLQEITHRSIAFESVDSRGFSGFMEPLQDAVAPLAAQHIDTAEPFDRALSRLVDFWDTPGGTERRRLERAVDALKEAEQRNTLASTIVGDIQGRTDLALLARPVLDFLCGPWAQVVAQARIRDRTGAIDPGAYAQAIEDLIWSAQPHLAARNRAALAKLVPDLVERLQAGLASIAYPQAGSADFFAVLASLHQQGLDASTEPAAPVSVFQDTGAPSVMPGESVWLAPTEALASGFIDLDTSARPSVLPPVPVDSLQPGLWVMLLAEDGWTRTRLIWSSPNTTLLLFSDALGYMQSLTRKACERMFADGQMRIISADPVSDALDAVAQAAMRNSVDIRF
jgi:hypothetical protein